MEASHSWNIQGYTQGYKLWFPASLHREWWHLQYQGCPLRFSVPVSSLTIYRLWNALMSVLSHSFRSLFLGNCLPSRESRQPVSAQPPCINLSVKSSRSKLKLCESVSGPAGPGLAHQTIHVHHVHTLYGTVSCKTICYTVII